MKQLEENYRSTRKRIGRGRWLCMVLTFLSLAFFITLTGLVLFGYTVGKTYFLNSTFVLTVVSLACVTMLLVGLGALVFWCFLTRLRIRLENNYANISLHAVLITDHLARERAVLARELQDCTQAAAVERAVQHLQQQGDRKSELIARCDELHLMMDNALHYFTLNAKPYENEQ